MPKTWLSIRVDLVHGRAVDLWPRPGRIFAAARSHTFEHLAHAINVAFGRWDFAHLSEFVLSDGTRISHADPYYDPPEGTVELRTAKLSRLGLGEQFAYTFDLATTGSTCAQSDPSGSTRSTCTARRRPGRWRTGAGERSPTSMGGDGPTTISRARCHPTPRGATYLRSFRRGAGDRSIGGDDDYRRSAQRVPGRTGRAARPATATSR